MDSDFFRGYYTRSRWPSGLDSTTGDRVVLVSNSAGGTSLRNFDNSVYPILQCLSEETLKAVGLFYRVSMPEEVKGGTRVSCHGLQHS